MALTNLLPRTINTTGASCTGSDADSNRTYTLPDSGVLSSGELIAINGTILHEGAGNDYTMSGSVITFLNPVWDVDIILINYHITFGAPAAAALSTSTSLKYATPLMFGQMLGIIKDVPSWNISETPTNEAVGTGNGTTGTYYLDQKPVVSDSYILYADGSALTETTHYELDCDTGEITLTTAGKAACNTKAITAKYSYYYNAMKDSYIISVLSRAEKEVDRWINSTFTDGIVDNPAYPLEIEIQSSEGIFSDRIITFKKPVKDIVSALDGDITVDATTISLDSAQGGEQFPTSGYIIIGSEVITYTGVSTDDLTGCSRGVLGTTAAAHSSGDAVHSTIVFRSATVEGTDASYTVQPWGTSCNVTAQGLVYIYNNADPNALIKYGVADRVKIIYLYGYDVIPGDITRLTLILAKRMLIQDNVGKAMIAGRNEFNPEMFNADQIEIEKIVSSYSVLSMMNT